MAPADGEALANPQAIASYVAMDVKTAGCTVELRPGKVSG